MTGMNAELIAGAWQRRLPIASAVGIEDVAYDGGWGSLLAASAADVPLLLDALEAAEAERDSRLSLLDAYINERNLALQGDASGYTMRDSWNSDETSKHDLAVEAMVLSLYRAAARDTSAAK